MIIIPKDFPYDRIIHRDTSEGATLTYVAHNKSRLQITCNALSYRAFWTPNEFMGDCLGRIHKSGFLDSKEARFNAEFSAGELIDTEDWKPALERTCSLPDSDIRSVNFFNTGRRSIRIASLSNDRQLDIGVAAELDHISSLRGDLIMTSAPPIVKYAFNEMMYKFFPRKRFYL